MLGTAPHTEPSTRPVTAEPLLKAASDCYEAIVKKLRAVDRDREPELALRYVAAAARFASEFHTGRFADGAIENVAWEIGQRLDATRAGDVPGRPASAERPGDCDGRRRVVHVATAVMSLGGHTRTICHWATNDATSRHWLVLLDQQGEPVPPWLAEAIRRQGGEVIAFPPAAPLRHKAAWLRQIARGMADLVVLHHHPFDVVPTVALSADGIPPVAMLNHADHIFWLGSSAADLTLNTRQAGGDLCRERRFLTRNLVLPTILPPPRVQVPRSEARAALGIDPRQVMLLSIGRSEKYVPCPPLSFLDTAAKILDRCPEAHLYVVGTTAGEMAEAGYAGTPTPRMHLVGPVEEPALYRAAADVYLESFPFGSQGSVLEAAADGLPVVPAYAPLFELLVAVDESVGDLLVNPGSEEEYIERAVHFIRDPDARAAIGAELRRRVLVDHVGDGWLGRLRTVYEQTSAVEHSPRRIPATGCQCTDADLGLGRWHAIRRGRVIAATDPRRHMQGLLRHFACAAKDSREFRAAFRMHADSLGLYGWNRHTAGTAAKLVPQWLLRRSL